MGIPPEGMSAALRSFGRALLRRSRMEREMDDEMQFHLEARVEDLVARGLPPGDAVHRARHEFGDVIRWKEQGREAHGLRAVDELRADLRYAVRMLRRRPISSASAIVTLAIGIGLNAAVFSIVDWVLLRPLPFPSSHELVRVFSTAGPEAAAAELTYSEFVTFSQASGFRASGAFSTVTRVVRGNGIEPAHVTVARVAGNLFGVLGTRPDVGRAFVHEELASGAPVVILSHSYWRNRLSADPEIVGRTVTIDGRSHRVVGVMPLGHGYPATADLWRPLTAAEREDDDRENVMIARLSAGTSRDRARSELATLSMNLPGRSTASLDDLQHTEVRDVRAALTALWVSAAFILVMACANVAALIVARGADRSTEMAVRGALGASRARLVRQLLTESVLLAVIGGMAGLLLGRWTLDGLVAIAPRRLPRIGEITLDMPVALLGIAATFIVGLTVGLAPAFRGSRIGSWTPFATPSSRSTTPAGGRRVLVAAQMAIAVVLSVGAGLLARSLQYLVTIDHGFAADHLVAVDLYLRDGSDSDVRPLYRELIDRAESVSGVRSAAIAPRPPTDVAGFRVPVRLGNGTAEAAATLRPVTPRYFETVGLRLIQGRGFTAADDRDAPRVAIVNATFAREVLGGATAVGTALTSEWVDGTLSIVGVAGDVTPAGERDRPALYVPMDQMPASGGALLVRTERAPLSVVPALTTRLRAAAPALALDRIREVADILQASRAVTRFNTQVASSFAALALLLAVVGAYGLTAGEVSARWRELAVRLALGANRLQTLWTVMRPGAAALGAGIAAGVIAAPGVGIWMRALLHGVAPAEPSVVLPVSALLAAVGLLAAALAGARVLRVDPAATLRRE